MGKREGEQEDLFVTHQQLRSQSHPFYRAVNRVLADQGFDRYVERLCAKFYAKKMGRPGLAPGIYFRSLLLGFFEGIDSERGIAWRAADSLSLRDFLGVPASKLTPDHSTISRTRRLIDLETHQAVFTWVLGVLDGAGLIKGKTIGVDATTLEANAAMRSIVRRDDGRTYQTFLEDLAKASGIETPTREDLARLDRKRKKKGSNDDWYNPNDPDAKITKMKDGRTHLAHKEEHAVDLDTGAVVAVTLVPASAGDTATIEGTLDAAVQNLDDAREIAGDESQREGDPEEAVGGQGLPQQDGAAVAATRGLAHVHRRASTWSAEMAGAAGGARRGVRESSTQERAPWPRVDAPARRANRAALRSRLRDRRHATHSPTQTREHRQAAPRAHRGAQPRLAHANALRRRQTEVPPGPGGRSWGHPHRVATRAAGPLATGAAGAPVRAGHASRRRSPLGLSGGATYTTGC